MRQPIPILGVPIDDLKKKELHGYVDGFLHGDGFHRIATVNPEFLVEADRNPTFRDALLSADFRIADGIGIVLAGWLRGKHIFRCPGADLLDVILIKAERGRLPVFFAVRKNGLSSFDDVSRAVGKKYPDLIFSGKDIDCGIAGDLKSEIGNPAIVLCNFGAPEQEYFLERLRKAGISSRLGMGVGGSFDFLTGKRRRAPRWMRTIGLEWLWRLSCQPKRFFRIWNATAVFAWKLFRETKTTR